MIGISEQAKEFLEEFDGRLYNLDMRSMPKDVSDELGMLFDEFIKREHQRIATDLESRRGSGHYIVEAHAIDISVAINIVHNRL